MIRRLCVFCGSSSGFSGDYAAAAEELGQTLAGKDIGLVYGGARVGIMGIVADAALKQGGEVIGVIPDVLMEKELAHEGLNELKVVSSMHKRKALMDDLSDGFIALPGGFGTLDEFFEALTWAQLGFNRKPSGLLDVNDYYKHLRLAIDHMVAEGFVNAAHRDAVLYSNDAGKLIDAMNTYESPQVSKWMDERAR